MDQVAKTPAVLICVSLSGAPYESPPSIRLQGSSATDTAALAEPLKQRIILGRVGDCSSGTAVVHTLPAALAQGLGGYLKGAAGAFFVGSAAAGIRKVGTIFVCIGISTSVK